jgi:hypothetical protein
VKPAQQKLFKFSLSAVIGALFLLFLPQKAEAAFSFWIKKVDKQNLSQKEQEVKVTLGINELPSESYFRVAFQEKSGQPYFGFIKNETGAWTKIGSFADDCTGYYHVTDKSITELTIPLIIGVENEVDNGEYLIKGHRFTASCSSHYESTSSATINFSFPSPSPTPEPSPSPTPTPTPSPSPSPSPSPLASPIASPSPDLEDSVNSEEMLASLGGEILGATETAEASSSEEASQSAKPINPYWLSGGLILAGLIMLGLTIRSWYKV